MHCFTVKLPSRELGGYPFPPAWPVIPLTCFSLQVAPLTIHPAFLKAAEYFDLKIILTPLKSDLTPDLSAFKKVQYIIVSRLRVVLFSAGY